MSARMVPFAVATSFAIACASPQAPPPPTSPTASARTVLELPSSAPPSPVASPAPLKPTRSAELQRHIDVLPVIVRLDGLAPTPFVLRGELSPKRAAEMERVARAIIGDVARRFVGRQPDASLTPVEVCLFESDKTYAEFAPMVGDLDTMMGFYQPRARVIVANLKRATGNLRHELVHPMITDHFPLKPAWLNEGLGALYGTARITGRGVEPLVNYRLLHVRKALRRGQLPSLEHLATSTYADLHGDRSAAFYGTARYLLMYLDVLGKLDDFYREMRAKPPTAERQRELLTRYVDYHQFIGWTTSLRIGARPAKVRP